MPRSSFFRNLVEVVTVKDEEDTAKNAYVDVVLDHTTALQPCTDVVHPLHRAPPEPPPPQAAQGMMVSDIQQQEEYHETSPLTQPADTKNNTRLYSNVIILPVLTTEPTHVPHIPANRRVVASSDDYIDYVLPKPSRNKPSAKSIKSKPNLQSSISVTIVNPDLSEVEAEIENGAGLITADVCDNTAEEEDLEELPPFRPRVTSYDTEQVAMSVANIRKKKMSQELELLRSLHEQNADVFHELQRNKPHDSSGKNREMDVMPLDVSSGDQVSVSPEEDTPIYAQPNKPKVCNVNRTAAEQLLSTFGVGDFLIRQNKGTTIISVKVHNKIKHIKLEVQKEFIKVGKESFLNLNELVQFYREQSPVSQTVSCVYLRNEIRFKPN